MPYRRRLSSFFTTVRSWAPLMLEMALTMASARIAVVLFTQPQFFEKYAPFYDWLVRHFPSEEWKWGILALVACLLKLVGMTFLAFRHSNRMMDLAFMLRTAGWSLSVVFWTCFALSVQFGEPWSVSAIGTAAMAQLSIAALVMGPAMPEETYEPPT